MFDDLIGAVVGIAIALIIAFPLGKQLKKRPGVFYLVAAVVVVLYAVFCVFWKGTWWHPSYQSFVEPLRKCYIAAPLLGIVMFTGVLNEGSALRKRLQPIRAELSILSLILFCAHIASYVGSYFNASSLSILLKGNTSNAQIFYGLIVAVVLTVIYILLSLLSLRVFRTKMHYKSWKNIQRLSYVMVALLLLHIWFILGFRPTMKLFAGEAVTMSTAVVTFIVYTVLIVVYAVLRIRKLLGDLKRRSDRAAALDAEKAIVQERAGE
jgi:DMSO/TMAO reductase YedYZ heme-binding membrane subunit